MTKEINDKLKEREEVRRNEDINTEAYKSLNEEASRLSTEVKRGIWQRKLLESNGMSEMWQVLKCLIDNKPNNKTNIIIVNDRACVSQRQKANAFMNMYKSMSSLNLAKEDRGVIRILSRTLRTLEETNVTWPGYTTSEVRVSLSNLNGVLITMI